MVSPFLFDRITIIGLGLIGSSIARAARKYKLAETIVGCDTNDITVTFARSGKIIDIAMSDLPTAVRDSNVVILATPPSTMGEIALKMSPGLREGTIVMDTASVKEPVMHAISRHIPSHVDYVPAHPVAGSEQSGISAGRAELFDGRRVIVTPNEPLQERMMQTINRFWNAMGARVEGIPPQLHDLIYAHVSHLPHLLAFAVKSILSDGKGDETLQKFVRLQRAEAGMWADIFLLNRDPLLKALDRYLDALWHINSELSRPPEGEQSQQDNELALRVLFPRIAASCLITTVMEIERQQGIPLARYAGTGFADFTAPATAEPEHDIEAISSHYLSTLAILQDYIVELKRLHEALSTGNKETLVSAL